MRQRALARAQIGMGQEEVMAKEEEKADEEDDDEEETTEEETTDSEVKTNYSNFRAWSSKKFEIAALLGQSKIITNTLTIDIA